MLGFRLPFARRKGYGIASTGGGALGVFDSEPGLWIDYTNGNDTTGNGTSGTPYKTLSKAISVVSAGGIINCKTANYYEAGLTCATNNVTIRAGTGHTPVFVHATAYAAGAWTKTGGLTNVYQATYTAASCWYVWNDSVRLTSVASSAICDATSNSYFFDDPGNLVYVNIGGSAPTLIHIEQTNSNVLTMTGTAQIVDGLYFQWTMQHGLVLSGASQIGRNCVARYWGGFGGDGFSPFCISGATSSTLSSCSTTMVYNSTDVGIFVTGSTGATVSGCTITDVNNGIRVGGASTGTVISGNTVTHVKFDGIQCSAGTITISNNVVVNPMTHGGITLDTTTSTGTVHHNLVYWNLASAGAIYGYINHATDGRFYNNVTANGLDASASTIGFLMAAGAGNAGIYYNNIAYKCGVGYSYSSGTLTSDYNDANGNSTNFNGGWTDGAHGITTDPLFTDQANDIYTLQAGSPCIDAGVVVAGITDGYLGAAPDIGYQEKA